MAGIHYYLVGQEKFNHQFQIIDFYPDDYFYGAHQRLEQLDLLSTTFESEEKFVQFLYDKGRLPSPNYHVMIAFFKNKDIKFYNVIYNDKYNKHLNNLRKGARESLLDTKAYIKSANDVIKEFYDSVKTNDRLYSMLTANATNIYGKFLDFFKTKDRVESFSDLKNRDGGWFLRSYTLLRNIVEAECHYEKLNQRSDDFYRSMVEERRMNERELLKGKENLRKLLCDRDNPMVIPGQLSLFDVGMLSEGYTVPRKSPTGYILEKDMTEPKQVGPTLPKKKRIQIPDYSEIDHSTKVAAVFSTLNRVGVNPLKLGTYGQAEFSSKYFSYPVSSEKMEKLNKYMDKRTLKNCYYYMRYDTLIDSETRKGFSVCRELYEDRAAEASNLRTKFKNEKTLNRAYAWCVVFQECLQEQQEYDERSRGENSEGRVYVKK